MPETVVSNAKLVLADEVMTGSIKILDGHIEDVSKGTVAACDHDFEGDYLIPGLIELHTDNLERHSMPRPGSFWPVGPAVMNHDRELIASGITTVFDAMSVGYRDQEARSTTSLLALTDAIADLTDRGLLKADHFLHWRCEVSGDNMIDAATQLFERELTGLVSVMDHTPGQRQFVKVEAYYTYYQGKYGLTDEEMKAFIEKSLAAHARNSEPNRRQVVKLAHEKNIPIASHDDATEEHVDEAIADGIVVAEFPTTLEAAKASHKNGLLVLMGAPNVVRGKSHSGNVSARELADAGVLDILSSDYLPFSLLYGAILLEEHCEAITLPDAIATVTSTPAKQVGLTDRGEIAVGKRADLVRFSVANDIPNIIEVWGSGKRVG